MSKPMSQDFNAAPAPEVDDLMRYLPPTMLFRPKPTAAAGEVVRTTVSSSSMSTFYQGDRISFDIPVGQPGIYLDPSNSYFQLKITNSEGAPIELDGSLAAVIDTLEVWSGSDCLTRITNYGAVMNGIIDATVSTETRASAWGACGSNNAIAYGSSAGLRGGATIANATSSTFCIPLLGGFGVGSSTYWPTGMTSTPIRVDVTLNKCVKAFVKAAAFSATPLVAFSDARLHLTQIKLDSAVHNRLVEIHAPLGGMFVPTTGIQVFTSYVSANSGILSIPISCRQASVSSVIMMMFDAAQFASSSANPHSDRTLSKRARADIQNWSVRVGANRYPALPVTATSAPYAEARLEMLRVFKQLNTASIETSITSADYATDAFMLGVSLDAYGSSTGQLRDGLNLQYASNLQIEGTFGTGQTMNLWVVVAVMYDQLLQFADGTIRISD